MLGGEISENTSWYGGGIELWGSNASMNLNGGSINNNNAIMVSDDRAIGGGIAVMNGATLTINDGEISYNQSMNSNGIGGGIMVGNDKMYNSVRGATLIMNGGKVSSNKANGHGGCGGGIYIQSLSTATINKGEITNNSCGDQAILAGASGIYGGGGIYVNGGKAGYEDGKLYIPSAYISNNTANRKEGAGIAGCGTSTIYIYPEKATIYGNDGSSQVYVNSTLSTGYGNVSKVFISEYALGGGINHWSDINREISPEELTNMKPETILALENSNAENLDTTGELADVKITGNTSETRGGGIGSNGYVQIGEKIVENVEGSKTWNDNNNKDGLRPESITINLYANGELKESKTITEDDEWKWSFTDLDKYDGNNKIEYTITEDNIEGYSSKVDGYSVINTQETSIQGTKTWNDNDNKEGIRPESITINLLSNGTKIKSKVITAEDKWEYSFNDLLKYDENGNEIIYTITEDKVDGYETKIDGYNIINTYKKEESKDPENKDENNETKDPEDENENDEDKTEENEKMEEVEDGEGKHYTVKTSDNIIISFIILVSAIGIGLITTKLREHK